MSKTQEIQRLFQVLLPYQHLKKLMFWTLLLLQGGPLDLAPTSDPWAGGIGHLPVPVSAPRVKAAMNQPSLASVSIPRVRVAGVRSVPAPMPVLRARPVKTPRHPVSRVGAVGAQQASEPVHVSAGVSGELSQSPAVSAGGSGESTQPPRASMPAGGSAEPVKHGLPPQIHVQYRLSRQHVHGDPVMFLDSYALVFGLGAPDCFVLLAVLNLI